MSFYDTMPLEELKNKHIETLEEALTCLEFTTGEDGLYYYDAGHDEPWEACEGTIRENLQTLERFSPELPEDGNKAEALSHHRHRLYAEAFNLVLADILSRPGYIPLAERQLPEWKLEVRDANIETLSDALNELEAAEVADGTFVHTGEGDSYPIDEAYCLAELEVLNSAPALSNDEGIDFWPYHNLRFWRQSLELVLGEIREREAAK
jgi:hypothetical protein